MKFPEVCQTLVGRWREVFASFNINLPKGRGHGPCPMCGGKDRFRLDDKGRGRWFCNNCGSGDGVDLLCRVFNWSNTEVLHQLNNWLGNAPVPLAEAVPVEREQTLEERLSQLQQNMIPIRHAHQLGECLYLKSKGYEGTQVIQTTRILRFPLSSGKQLIFTRGATILRLYDWKGQVVALQGIYPVSGGRFFKRLLPGSSKAHEYGTHRLIGTLKPAAPFVICEGYATAEAISRVFPEVNVIFALDAGNLLSVAQKAREHYPDNRICIAADNDENGAGQRGALKVRAAMAGIEITWPIATDSDWDDAYRFIGAAAMRREFVAQREKLAALTLDEYAV